ncbi:hypothetical protein [Cohnella abietis]|uniref:Uncharacterized protein n=1 Tax=Cohnella abietis TaxID=2507935 RepID=A0A3T1D8T8_9BACL|nr:hypothetical protein [Cohnella abietis]BBI34493.1 hypothetical protein KCTCHS21_38920 [Cohnella abietis]
MDNIWELNLETIKIALIGVIFGFGMPIIIKKSKRLTELSQQHSKLHPKYFRSIGYIFLALIAYLIYEAIVLSNR